MQRLRLLVEEQADPWLAAVCIAVALVLLWRAHIVVIHGVAPKPRSTTPTAETVQPSATPSTANHPTAVPTVRTTVAPIRQASLIASLLAGKVPITPTGTPAPPVITTAVLRLAGTGSQTSTMFRVPTAWQVQYGFDCSSLPGDNGSVRVVIFNADGSPLLPASLADVGDGPFRLVGERGTGSRDFADAGTYYLSVQSECSWSIIVASAKQ